MTPIPGWADDAPRTATLPPRILPEPEIGPALLAPETGGLIRHQAPDPTDPKGLAKSSAGWLGSFGLLGGSVAVLVLGSFGLGLALLLDDLFTMSPVLGWAGVAVGAAAGGLLARALGREWLALRRLEGLDRLSLLLRDTPDAATPPAALLSWAAGLARRLPEAAPAVAQMHRATTTAELRGLFATGLAPVLDAEVKRLGWQSARQVFLTTAILPSPALDAMAMALLGLRLMRQVAVLHGLRPGVTVLWRLLRRLALSAGMTAGADLVAEAGVEQFLEGHAAKLAGGAAGATVAARRMLRLATATAGCCRPFGETRR